MGAGVGSASRARAVGRSGTAAARPSPARRHGWLRRNLFVSNEGAEEGAAPRSVPKVKGLPRSQAEAREAPPSSPPPARFAGNRFPRGGRGRSAPPRSSQRRTSPKSPGRPSLRSRDAASLRSSPPNLSEPPLDFPSLAGAARPASPHPRGNSLAAAVRHLHPGLKCTAVLKEIHPHPTQIHPQRCLNTPGCLQKFLPKPDAWTTRAEIHAH
ncbi:uncharacterized protein LOC117093283 [Trachypithecus francoisi]|uniref:uncharacterized protein LOC117093283 n=1 Tax=Trachypithecus francoisi TaxID=54180 RepID=UPI00141AE308|nr:uncharacterized protein LOC117093283 [Trachypithecus francoisi]